MDPATNQKQSAENDIINKECKRALKNYTENQSKNTVVRSNAKRIYRPIIKPNFNP